MLFLILKKIKDVFHVSTGLCKLWRYLWNSWAGANFEVRLALILSQLLPNISLVYISLWKYSKYLLFLITTTTKMITPWQDIKNPFQADNFRNIRWNILWWTKTSCKLKLWVVLKNKMIFDSILESLIFQNSLVCNITHILCWQAVCLGMLNLPNFGNKRPELP